MASGRTLHSGGICAGDRKLFILLKDRRWMGGRKMNQEGQEIFDLKPLTKEEVAFYRLCQGVVSSKMGRYERGS